MMFQLLAIAMIFSFMTTTLAQGSTIARSVLSATGSVVPVLLFLGGDGPDETLVASVIGQNNGVQTLLVTCAPDVASTQCDYQVPATITVGTSTVHATNTYPIIDLSVDYNCDITGYTMATCTYTAIGRATDLANDTMDAATAIGITTVITTVVLSQDDISFAEVTITAGPGIVTTASPMSTNTALTSAPQSSNGGSASAGPSSASANASKVSSSTSGDGGGVISAVSSAASSAIASSTSRAGVGQIVTPGCFAAGVLGLAIFL